MKKSWVSGLLLVCLLLAFFLVSACSREEKIEIKEEDGVTAVYNPKKPAPPRGGPSTLSLKEELVLGKTGNEETMLLNPRAVEADQAGNIYVIDGKAVQIKVYDPQGNFVRAIGRRGQGPGEFQSPRSFCLTPQLSLAVCDSLSRQVVIFGLDGQFIRALPDKTRSFMDVRVNAKGDIIATQMVVGEEAREELVWFDSELKPLLTVASVQMAKYPVFNPFPPYIYFGLTADGNVLWGVTTDYTFNVVNSEGKTVRKIIKNYDPEILTQEDKDRKIKETFGEEGAPSDVTIEWSKYFPAFQDFVMDERGWLYVRPYTKEKVEKGVIYDVFDADGRYVARVVLPDRAMAIKYGKLYTIEEDAEGMRLVKRYALEWK
ncbi:MAG TPA: 6-bladed beta-propeller [Candidatus Saccharicenans sp.]|nr:6-bladed beta-propeller [Candidatus Saccharicenans sp.]